MMRSAVRIETFVALGLIIVPAVGFTQEKKQPGQAAIAKLTGLVHDRLDDLSGSWDVTIRYTFGDKEHEGKATCEAKWILDGHFLQQVYLSRFQGKPYEVIQLLGYDTVAKKTIEIKLDNRSTGILHNEGSISEDGKVMTNFGQSLDQDGRKPYKLRTVTTIVDHDHFTLEWFGTADGGKEAKVVSMFRTRKKA